MRTNRYILWFALALLAAPARAETRISRRITDAAATATESYIRRTVPGLRQESPGRLLAHKMSEMVRGFRVLPMDTIRMNPADPASQPAIGPSMRAVATYRRALVSNRVDLTYSLEPVRVRVVGDAYELADGHHRYLAAKILRLRHIHGRVIE